MNKLPISFLVALSKDKKALSAYADMSLDERDIVLRRACSALSREEINSLVESLRPES